MTTLLKECGSHTNESCEWEGMTHWYYSFVWLSYESVPHMWMTYLYVCHVTCECVPCHMWMCAMSYMWPCHQKVVLVRMCHDTHMNESRCTYAWNTTHIWISRYTRMNELWRTQEWVMGHDAFVYVSWLRHDAFIYVSCLIYMGIMTHSSDMTLQDSATHSATHCTTLQHTATHCNTLQHTVQEGSHFRRCEISHSFTCVSHSLSLSVSQCVAVCCSVLQCVAVCWSECVAVCLTHSFKCLLTHSMTHSHLCRVSHFFKCVTWHIHICAMTQPHVWHDSFAYVFHSFKCVTWRIDICAMTQPNVWHDSFSCVSHSFKCVTWHIYICAMTQSLLWHDSYIIGLESCDSITLQYTATHCNTLQHTAAHCDTLRHTATHSDTLRHAATRCNIL